MGTSIGLGTGIGICAGTGIGIGAAIGTLPKYNKNINNIKL
jgi:hypothetical protein